MTVIWWEGLISHHPAPPIRPINSISFFSSFSTKNNGSSSNKTLTISCNCSPAAKDDWPGKKESRKQTEIHLWRSILGKFNILNKKSSYRYNPTSQLNKNQAALFVQPSEELVNDGNNKHLGSFWGDEASIAAVKNLKLVSTLPNTNIL